MSRAYDMALRVKGFDKKKYKDIKSAAEKEWNFDGWLADNGELEVSAEGSLCGGETEDEFVTRLSCAIWKANGKYCEVEVTATFLEDLPCEIHAPSEEDYGAALAAGKLDSKEE